MGHICVTQMRYENSVDVTLELKKFALTKAAEEIIKWRWEWQYSFTVQSFLLLQDLMG